MEPNPHDQDELGKEASNLMVLISELYSFQVISCILIYDLVRDLLNKPQLLEYNVELLLKIVRSECLHPYRAALLNFRRFWAAAPTR